MPTKKTPDPNYSITSNLDSSVNDVLTEVEHHYLNSHTEAQLHDLVSDQPLAQYRALTPLQNLVIFALAKGAPIKIIAEETGISPATISNWRRTNPQFREKLARVQAAAGLSSVNAKFDHIGVRAAEIAEEMMENPETPAGTRLQAAIMFIEQVRGKPNQKTEHTGNLLQTFMSRLTAESEQEAIDRFMNSPDSTTPPDGTDDPTTN